MALPRNAQDEIRRRIAELDREESRERWQAEKLKTESADALIRAEAAARTRRQFEFALANLDGTAPVPPKQKLDERLLV